MLLGIRQILLSVFNAALVGHVCSVYRLNSVYITPKRSNTCVVVATHVMSCDVYVLKDWSKTVMKHHFRMIHMYTMHMGGEVDYDRRVLELLH